MKLSSLFLQGNQAYTETVQGQSDQALAEGLKNGLKELSGKLPGQAVSGEVISKDGNDLLLLIGKNQLLRAKLDGNMQVDIGNQMTFAIKSMMGNKVTLSPLFANTANDPNVLKALQMAGLPENETTVKMVQTMMQEGMPIDKNSLHQMMRTVSAYPDAQIDTLVQLTRLQIPVTQESIFQMNAYKNYEHQMTEGLLQIADSLAETVQSMAAEGNVSEGVNLYKEMFLLLSEQGQITEGSGALADLTGAQALTNGQNALGEGIQQAILTDADGNPTLQETTANAENSVLTNADRELLGSQLKQAGFEQLGDAIAKGQMTDKEIFSQVGKLLTGETGLPPEQAEHILKTLNGKEFQQLLKNEMKNQWMLTPEEVGQENKVENLYERLNQQMNRMNQVLEQAAQSGTSLAKAVNNVSGNIDFMNQLNQMFTYVQIPLKLQGKEASGDLYVYTNKKSLAENDGEVSALLHLDMENLGSVDVHVKMRDSKVSTQFFLEDDSSLDLIAEHIGMLNERLEKRGYSMTATFTKRDGQENVMEEMLKQDKNISVLAGYSFDARA